MVIPPDFSLVTNQEEMRQQDTELANSTTTDAVFITDINKLRTMTSSFLMK